MNWMKRTAILITLTGIGAVLSAGAEQPRKEDASAPRAGASSAAAVSTTPAAAVEPATAMVAIRPATADPCLAVDVAANATRPAWDYAASTTQCGVLESDYGFLSQPLGAGVSQRMLVTSLRYGLTPKLDLRWGLTDHIWQSGGSSRAVQGAGDQWLGFRYRLHEQGRVSPAMAVLYAGKAPTANPAKGLGSGVADHEFVFIASRDLGKSHFDFNVAGNIVGVPRTPVHGKSHDGAAQFGLALTRPVTKRLSGIFESYGGAQPGTPDRFGAGFAGVTYTLRPQLVLDAAYARTYTAGSPRQQVLFGVTYARRAGFAPLPRNAALARLLGR